MATETKQEWVYAKEAVVVVVGARPPEWERRLVRNRRTGLIEEVVLNEFDPVDEGDLGVGFAFAKHEAVLRDHPAVLDAPGAFTASPPPRPPT
jgi:hypothetical protein